VGGALLLFLGSIFATGKELLSRTALVFESTVIGSFFGFFSYSFDSQFFLHSDRWLEAFFVRDSD